MLQRLPEVSLTFPGQPEHAVGVGLLVGVAVLLGQGKGLVQVPDRVVVGVAESPVGVYAQDGVRQVRGGVQRGLPRGEPVVAVAPPDVECVDSPGQPPDGGVPGVADGGLERGALLRGLRAGRSCLAESSAVQVAFTGERGGRRGAGYDRVDPGPARRRADRDRAGFGCGDGVVDDVPALHPVGPGRGAAAVERDQQHGPERDGGDDQPDLPRYRLTYQLASSTSLSRTRYTRGCGVSERLTVCGCANASREAGPDGTRFTDHSGLAVRLSNCAMVWTPRLPRV